MAEFKYEILQHVCVLMDKNNGWRKELNVVRWNDGAPKLDIRDWTLDRSKMGKGLTFTRNEIITLQKNIRFVRLSEWEKYNEDGSLKTEQGDDNGIQSKKKATKKSKTSQNVMNIEELFGENGDPGAFNSEEFFEDDGEIPMASGM